ncbi:hypothetical protein XENTR_v10004901 [Xenopus tropicalis]|uniref:Melanocortin-2 receptor accessory protein n=1 Tax=Xenopus tropicalis TaxID=8364 RepID=A0A8J0QRQ3_XENTR|nr:melanocortin-2 receptor accessory protein [Xenopus tropicalis]KAE8621629.1 hypothetical protein XENTR_v10004901 [Xenopus tropicalis]|eukprot:XP_002938489.2 PREDICTED: melanocortin-2 receptor accessory protein [Xenopus tropicalis]
MIGAAKPSLILTCTQLVISGTSSAHNAMMADTGNVSYTYEDYYDYEDFASFDESEPRANKYSIVIALWVGLAMFVVFLFLILLYMSRTVARSKNTARRKRKQMFLKGSTERPKGREHGESSRDPE